jgi:hypothetical protein
MISGPLVMAVALAAYLALVFWVPVWSVVLT